jgi:hypothetical protein
MMSPTIRRELCGVPQIDRARADGGRILVAVEAVHAAVPGGQASDRRPARRAGIRALVEQGLATHPAVRQVSTSTITGNALVLYDPGCSDALKGKACAP